MPWKKGQSGNPGGRPKIAKEVRAEAQADSLEAYEIISKLMREADKDATRLTAAVKVLQLAGVPMSEDKAAEPAQTQPVIGKGATTEDLMAAAVAGEG